MRGEVGLHPLADRAFRWRSENALVPGDSGGKIPVRERDDPRPPTVAHQVVRGTGAGDEGAVLEAGGQDAGFMGIEAAHVAEPHPHRVDRVLREAAQVAHLAGEQRGSSRTIGDPSGGDGSCFLGGLVGDRVAIHAIQLEGLHRGGPDEGAALGDGLFKHVLIKLRAVELEGRHPHLGEGSDFRATARAVVGFRGVVEPHSQAVLLEMVAGEVVGKSEHPGQEAAGDLRGGFADLAIKFLGLLDDENPCFRSCALEEQGQRGTRKGTAKNDDIIVGGRDFGGVADHGK